MEKVTKSYIEKLYPGFIFPDTRVSEVESRDPMNVVNDGKMAGFRFYDIERIIDNEKVYEAKPSNYSNWYYYGVRFNLQEIKEKFANNNNIKSLIISAEVMGLDNICLTDNCRFVLMEDGDMTVDEYIKAKEKEKGLKLEK